MLIINENDNYTINLLNGLSNVSLTMVLVNKDNEELIFKVDFDGILKDFLDKYGDLIPSNTPVEVYLDLYLNNSGQKYHYATISESNELATQFKKSQGVQYGPFYSIKDDGVLTLSLIEESVMKGIIETEWENFTLSYEELESKINQLEALVNLNTQKLVNYRRLSASKIVKSTEMSKIEETMVKNDQFLKIMFNFYDMSLIYDNLSTKLTLQGDDAKKYAAIKSIVRHSNNFYKLINDNKGFPFIKER